MNVVRVKPGCLFAIVAPGGVRILGACDQVARDAGVDLEISCGTEGHLADDPHTKGEAYDVSVHGFSVDEVLDVRSRLMQQLGARFTVLYEEHEKPTDPRLAAICYVDKNATAPHLHVQVKNGVSYPPSVSVPGAAAV